MNYQSSTQRTKYLLTAEQLASSRQGNNAASVAATRKLRAENGMSGEPEDATEQPLTVEEELMVVRHYLGKLRAIATRKKWPYKVASSATSFLQRFYLRRSVMEHSPVVIMMTCLYIACKVEEHYYSAEDLCQKEVMVSLKASTILDHELCVLSALQFDLVIYHPHRAAEGLLQELQAWTAAAPGSGETAAPAELRAMDSEQRSKLRDRAVSAANVLMVTDALFLYKPGQLALAAIRSSFRDLKLPFQPFQVHLLRKQSSQGTDLERNILRTCEALDAIDRLSAQGIQPRGSEQVKAAEDKVRQLDARMRKWNPMLDPRSSVYKAVRKRRKLAAREARSNASGGSRGAANEAGGFQNVERVLATLGDL